MGLPEPQAPRPVLVVDVVIRQHSSSQATTGSAATVGLCVVRHRGQGRLRLVGVGIGEVWRRWRCGSNIGGKLVHAGEFASRHYSHQEEHEATETEVPR
jgi:hypothetical protein